MIGPLRSLARRVERLLRPGGRGLVLLYHRIADEPSDPYGLCVSPSDFEEHMGLLRDLGVPMSVPAMARAARDGELPERALGVTFDDAYLDVLQNAVPVLERYDVPATVFVTTGEGGRTREFWWDALERLLLQAPSLPEVLELEVGGEPLVWELGSHATDRLDGGVVGGRWHILDQETPSARHRAFRDLYYLLRPLTAEEQERVVEALSILAGEAASTLRPSHRVMTPDQVGRMAAGGLVDVGAHTQSHPELPRMSVTRQRQEIRRSRIELEEWTGRQVEGFAYPYGQYDVRSVEEVRRAGFAFACIGEHRAVRQGTRRLLLPRVDVLPEGRAPGPRQLVRRHLGPG